MRTLELCSGTGSFSKVAAAFGYAAVTVDSGMFKNPNIVIAANRACCC